MFCWVHARLRQIVLRDRRRNFDCPKYGNFSFQGRGVKNNHKRFRFPVVWTVELSNLDQQFPWYYLRISREVITKMKSFRILNCRNFCDDPLRHFIWAIYFFSQITISKSFDHGVPYFPIFWARESYIFLDFVQYFVPPSLLCLQIFVRIVR